MLNVNKFVCGNLCYPLIGCFDSVVIFVLLKDDFSKAGTNWLYSIKDSSGVCVVCTFMHCCEDYFMFQLL